MKEYIKLKRRIVYRGDVYNAIEGERINVLPKVFDSEYMNGIHDGLKKALSTLANDVKDIPAADVVEVRTGRWILNTVRDEWQQFHSDPECSECGFHPYYYHDHSVMKYCPNCGAKMDGGVNDAAD